MQLNPNLRGPWPAHAVVMGLSLWLAACGGGGSSAPAPVTALPELAITAPGAGDVAQAVTFATSQPLATGLKASWEFGDGGTSTDAAPRHSYAKAGTYEVRLTLSNEAGASRQYTLSLGLNRPGITRGLQCSKADGKGWCWQAPRPSGNQASWTSMVDAQVGWRVGGGGEVHRTLDGGKTWTRRSAPSEGLLTAVHALSSEEAWVLGDDDSLFHSSDGGTSWAKGRLPMRADEASFHVVTGGVLMLPRLRSTPTITGYFSADGGQGWVSRDVPKRALVAGGRVLATSPDNASVLQLDLPSGKQLERLSLKPYLPEPGAGQLTSLRLFAAGDVVGVTHQGQYLDAGSGSLVRQTFVHVSTDAGQSWKSQRAALPGSELSFSLGLELIGASPTGLHLAGQVDGQVLYSVNGGSSWQAAAVPDVFDRTAFTGCVTPAAGRLVCVPNPASFGVLAVSDDMGASWKSLKVPGTLNHLSSESWLKALAGGPFFVQLYGSEAYLVSAGGDSWTRLTPPYPYPSISHSFIDGAQGLTYSQDGHLRATQDGGLHWEERPPVATGNPLRNKVSVGHVDANRVLLLATDGLLHISSDGGRSWSVPSEPPFKDQPEFSLDQVVVQDARVQWARAWRLDDNTGDQFVAAFSTDGGARWKSMALPGPHFDALYRSPAGRITLVSQFAGVYQTEDEGKTWTQRLAGGSYLSALHSLDGQRLWAVGDRGQVRQSSDGGITWAAVDLGVTVRLHDVRFVDAEHGWITGDMGLILATSDGGKTWRRQSSGTSNRLGHIVAVDSRTVWIEGHNGSLLATGTGGD